MGFLAYNLTKKRYRLPPGPFAWPLLGNLLSMRSKEESLYVTLSRWAKEKYGPVITIYFGPIPCVTLNNIDVVTEALVQKGKYVQRHSRGYTVHLKQSSEIYIYGI